MDDGATSTKRGARGAYAKTAARRAAIIDAARESFVEHGYEEASLRDISRRAGISLPGLLHHFRDKAELLNEVLKQRDVAGRARSQELRAAGRSIASAVAQLETERQRDPQLMRLWAMLAPAASRPDHPAHEYFVERYRRIRSEVAANLRHASPASDLPNAIDHDTAAALIVAALEGLQVQWLLDPTLDIPTAVSGLIDLLVYPQPAGDDESAASPN
jgi:AcrR family transcriptional regulator